MTSSDDTGGRANQTSRQLRVIADTLGVPVEALFTHDAGGTAADHLSELLRLWSAIRDAAGRETVLTCARAVVAAQSGSGPA